ncbi:MULTISPECIES: 4-hydroxy-tetrahydrodipicolinate synthase [Actinotignum]|uniref:4-hydroxy-tetrahydrodipicolinate synthase n=1 Tax=Actinotignum timonense TaxID=1870995 RepID=A0AAW9HDQ3_9ACTO|nr:MULTISPECIES: 4-hydroxy-tetrahydrodipicolinate synthase [Actinotignum]MBS5748931.1 4-hydroxy-tetrahydrodipicolinate synthase [Actinotignum schaalii]MDE1535853.1 4-hydroxy-tetrahydrodipicolinate synthase [Actinotignum schaalii]MDE1559229.1 4-hydroxy-tetrahydrodipicolinate synthase [Actinotignum schaalii]MDE1663928.1 4-hydroxy-tetrahydrodipicolinate synthase [Actinotignum schaalii]MDK6374165.1 4-hydroxy-tetrahydrodipicolinate synthase [Actinotignum timonense]
MEFHAEGVIPALVTPLDREGNLLEQGLRDVIDYTITNGVHGIFVLGSSGEIYGLDNAQKRRVVEIAVEQANGRVPVYAGASEITTRDCIKTAHMVQEVGGVSALSVLTPYFMTPTQSELVEHYKNIAAETDLPILVYSNPGRTQVPVALTTMLELVDVPNIIGIKDSAGNLTLTGDYIRELPDDFDVIMGRDTLIYPALCLGAAGAIASTANIAPKLVSSIYNEYRAGNRERALELQNALSPLRNLVDVATFPVVLKEGLRMAGVEAGYCFAPARELAPEFRPALEKAVEAVTNI